MIKPSKWNHLPGSRWKKLPPFHEKKRIILNIENQDEECLAYSIAASLLKREAMKAKAIENEGTPTTTSNPEAQEIREEDFLNDEVQYVPSPDRNPFLAREIRKHFKPNQYRKHFERFGLTALKYPCAPQSLQEIEDILKLKLNIFSFFD